MEDLSQWFRAQLTTSAEAFIWAVEQIPTERLLIAPPEKLGEWSVARHVFHLLSYERRLALPNMRCWLGESFERDNDYQEEAEWAKGHDLATFLAEFRQLKTEEIALLKEYKEEDWERVGASSVWPDVSLRWVVTKTLQHTFAHNNDVLAIGLFWNFFAEQEALK
ncbi:MAG: DinB family protein [Ktedonobacteraceae bacterium]